MRLSILAVLLLLGALAFLGATAPPARALPFEGDPWSARDLTLQSVYTTLAVIDWGQTLYFREQQSESVINRCPDGTRPETNPILGECPSSGRVNVLIGSAILAHWTIAHLLPSDYRLVWQAVFIVFEAEAVHRNYKNRDGIKLGFHLTF
jgi:hypothetical protein